MLYNHILMNMSRFYFPLWQMHVVMMQFLLIMRLLQYR